jgi:hypothetical protein
VPVNSRGISDPADWPDACEMLTEAELKQLVPGATRIERDGQRGEFMFSGDKTPNNVTCTYEMSKPGQASYDSTEIEISLRGVAGEDQVKESYEDSLASARKTGKKYPDQFDDYGDRFGAECFYNSSSLQCRDGKWDFWLYGRAPIEGDYNDSQRKFREGTLGEVARILSAKMG